MALLNGGSVKAQATPGADSVIVAGNGTTAELVSGVLEALGGMDRFVEPGDRVLIKPNASFSVAPNMGANTSPEVASAVVRLAFDAGASQVILADHTINKPGAITVQINGLKEATEGCGGEFAVLQKASDFEPVEIEGGSVLMKVDVAKLYNECDVLINLPVMKHHEATGSSVGLKNLMGLVYDRTVFHREGLDTCIAELSLSIRPDVTIVDATRTLMSNGPRGPGELVEMGKVVAGTDPVAVDVACLALGSSMGYDDFNLKTRNAYIGIASQLGIGDGDPVSVLSKTFDVDVKEGVGPCIVGNGTQKMPEWVPYAFISAASVGLGLAAMVYDRRKMGSARSEER